MEEKPRCDLGSVNFTHSLFDFVLHLVEDKLSSQQNHQMEQQQQVLHLSHHRKEVPQLGPLAMDVAFQRQSVIARALQQDSHRQASTPPEVPLEMDDETEFMESHCTKKARKYLRKVEIYLVLLGARQNLLQRMQQVLVDIYLHAVRRLVLSARVGPGELRELRCR